MEKPSPRSKNGWIEIFRFLLACAIVGLYMSGYYAEPTQYFHGSYIAVDCFFVLTGLLTMISLQCSYQADPQAAPLQRLLQLLKKKLAVIYPLYLLSFVVLFLFQEKMEYHNGLYGMLNGLAAAIGEILGIAVLGLGGGVATGGALYYNIPGWYFSAMMIGLAILLFLAIWLKDLFLAIIAPAGAVLLYGYLHLKVGHLQIWEILGDQWLFPLWRAVAGFCLGAFSSNFHQRLSVIRLRPAGKALRSVVELLLASGVLGYTLRPWAQYGVIDFSIPFLCALLFPLLLSHPQGKSTAFNKVAYFLGWISLPLWLNHYLVIRMFRVFQFQGNIYEAYISILFISLAVGAAARWLSSVLVKTCKLFIQNCRNILIEE